MGSEGRRSAAYRRTAARFQQGDLPCWHCGLRPGTTVDHDPPLSSAPSIAAWHGVYRPACQPCQSKQGGKIAAERTAAARRWTY